MADNHDSNHDKLKLLHERLTDRFLRLLEDEELELSTATISAMITFLKNNDIRAMPGDDAGMQKLREKAKSRFGNADVANEFDAALDDVFGLGSTPASATH